MSQWKHLGLRRWGFAVAIVCWSAPKDARAQIDTNPPLHNVMLLVDSSGSMEYANDGSSVTCDQVDPGLAPSIAPQGASQKTRWMQLVEVLTGDVKEPGCYSQDRSTDAFRDEYKLGSTLPYDYNYHVPYHRFLSGSGASACTIGAGVVDSNPFAWGSTPFKYHLFNNRAASCTNFTQSETGLLDSYRDRMRFGLMTFDTSVDAGTGLASVSSANYATGAAGTWSYFQNWQSNNDCLSNHSSGNRSACATGRPAGCSTAPAPMEVGARNASAPPWEGRMVPFGSPGATITDVRNTNDNIQKVLTAVRPFGATPINGLLSDARDFFLDDQDDDYVAGATCDRKTGVGCFGPKYDGLVANGCRKNNIILLTDGEPNLDLRPYCEGTSGGQAGFCPYNDKSADIVHELATADPNNSIQTFVIGFAVSTVSTGPSSNPQLVDCTKISAFNQQKQTGTFDPNNVCGPGMDPNLSACCTLAKIAFYGGTGNAYFANDATSLRSAMSDIFDRIGGVVSTRTAPVFANGSTSTFGAAVSFFSSFHSGRDTENNVALQSSVWTGVLERQRITCRPEDGTGPPTAHPERIDNDQGDSFSTNVNNADSSHPRAYYTFIAEDDGSGKRWSERSIRPTIPSSNPDGLGTAKGASANGDNVTFVAPLVPPAAMSITQNDCTADGAPTATSDDACASKFLKWEVGVDPMPSTAPGVYTRPNVFGAIYHSTPRMVGWPNEYLRDESYTQFTVEQVARPPMLYTETTDGQLHAFKAGPAQGEKNPELKKVNNEIWSFFPPAVLPRLPAQFPRTQQMILDGVPVVKDVVFVRSDSDAKSGGPSVKWHTVLVSSFGAGGTGYFAVDITNPIPKTGDATTGPQFLWQLTTDSLGNRLFGKSGATPVITTLFFTVDGDPKDAQEYAVAILPGGDSGSPTEKCTTKPSFNLVDSTKPPRDEMRCLVGDPARSLTIVRLDTGEVIRSFRREIDGPSSILGHSHDALNVYTPLVAAISGQPVAFPSETGAVADRAFVGDREGLLWRVDFSSTNPQEWKMDLFFDAYTGGQWTDGQPIATPPILSVDGLGNLTVAFSTGDQEQFIATPSVTNYLWSVSEDASATPPFQSRVNWPRKFINGARVSGQIQLFNSNLYYTTYTPPPLSNADQCSDGSSEVCGQHYLRPAATADTGGETSVPALPGSTNGCVPLGKTVNFGPGITQEPTCFQADNYDDPYLSSGGQHTSLSGITAGKFKLSFQTGAHGTSETGGQVNTQTIDLETPLASTRVDSWAAVVE